MIYPLKIGTFYSQDGQDLFLSSLLFNYLNNNPNSWVVDIGCNHPSHFSNSLFFEKWFGCRVLAIDPLAEFGKIWARERPTAKFISTAVGCSTVPMSLNIPQGDFSDNMFATVTGGVSKAIGLESLERTVQCKPLSSILAEQGITEVLLMSIDVEGVELDVLKSINLDVSMIRCMVIENNSKNLFGSNEIRDYLTSRGYAFFARIGYLDDVFIHKSMISGHPNSLLF
jgi:FkbM family methyltransferase